MSEAFARAGERWASGGVPENPAGWLYTTAWRQVLGRLRSEAIHGRKAALLAVGEGWVEPPNVDHIDALDDERLMLVLLCCHPAVHPEARSPLALRLVIGTSTAEIARLFLVPRATMAARITRAKKKIAAAGIPLTLPADQELQMRLRDVCRTVYLAFTAGYTPGEGADLLRTDLAGEAVELAAVLHRLVPHDDQVCALYALLLLQHARRDARIADGRLITLPEQDRSRWRRTEIEHGAALAEALPEGSGYAEELRLQARIAAVHGRAATAADTEWRSIAELYQRLETVTSSPVVRLNRAVAVAEVEGPAAGLALLDGLEAHLPASHRVAAVRADLAARNGDREAALSAYTAALELCSNEVERAHLEERRAAVEQARD